MRREERKWYYPAKCAKIVGVEREGERGRVDYIKAGSRRRTYCLWIVKL